MFSRSKATIVYEPYDTPPLSIMEADRLFDFQMTMKNPKQIGPATFCVMGIGDVKLTLKATKKLNEMGILLSSRNQGGRGIDDIVITEAIPPGFSKKMKFLNTYQQKRLITVLFAWRDELMRFRLLDDEISEMNTLILEEHREGNDEVGHLEVQLMELEGLWKLKPSLRHQRNADVQEDLPDYTVSDQY